MKKLLFVFLIFVFFAFKLATITTKVSISSDSKLLIKGKTNVNSFTCKYAIPKIESPIVVHFKRMDNKMVFENTVLVLKNDCFDCGGKIINNDFRKLLKSEVYPNTRIKLKEIYTNSSNNKVLALVDITIAGITNSYSLPVVIKSEEQMSVSGLLNLNICDFNLDPPKKAMGMIVVDEIIQINFQLNVKEN